MHNSATMNDTEQAQPVRIPCDICQLATDVAMYKCTRCAFRLCATCFDVCVIHIHIISHPSIEPSINPYSHPVMLSDCFTSMTEYCVDSLALIPMFIIIY
jgi:hypothetical protein